ncbi:polysaccharide export outer membrane protein [Chryseobacterium piscicola]|uniref:Polysaccharide export outer membrane protein n=2 Tax=Chryseobacterium piscicola TaxID=551459 RepID=A0A1N7NHH4_9FLAO|nr:sugar transporter [Chryseobacterium piscicola]SIS97711.1 polysaccharide export outer membrane protein [Chryseobacterium piscicola]
MNFRKKFIFGATIVILASCTPRQEINYMTDIDNIVLDNSIKNSRSNLQPGDQIIITVSARDMDVVKPFNQNYSSTNTISQYSSPSSNNIQQQLPVSGPNYLVDSDYNIIFSQIGQISVQGENIESFRRKMTELISKYVKDPIVDVKLINFRVSVVGEVARPGTYVVPDGNATLISALGLAGDLTAYGIRKNILVLRNVDGKFTKERVDLTSAKFINSPYYYLKQNDIIYVEPNSNREKAARTDPNTGLYISIASLAGTLVLGILALVRR